MYLFYLNCHEYESCSNIFILSWFNTTILDLKLGHTSKHDLRNKHKIYISSIERVHMEILKYILFYYCLMTITIVRHVISLFTFY